ncbi:MAG: hypothetical protein KA319_03715 [Ferruginibacter sp.]|nr:hypothetical protein [Ferruginibacter sp.]
MLGICSHIRGQQLSAFQSFTIKEGLPSNYVLSIDEDENGFLWVGTDKGLAKFDGFTWKIFNTDNGLPGNYIPGVFCTKKGGIWLGIGAKGMHYFDIATNKASFVTNGFLPYHLQFNKNGELFYYNDFPHEKKGIIKGFSVSPKPPFTSTKVFEFKIKEEPFIYTDFENKKISINKFTPNIQVGFHLNFIESSWKIDTLFSQANITGLSEKIADGIFHNGTTISFNTNGVNSKLQLYKPFNRYFNAIQEKNIIWTWNEEDGFFSISENGKTIKHYTQKDGLANNIITDVHALKNGNLLIGTLGNGIQMLLPNGNARIDTDGKPIKSIAQQGNSIYALLSGKIIQFDLGTSQLAQTFEIPDKNVQAINIWDDNFYVSTLSGFSVYKKNGISLVKKNVNEHSSGISSVIKMGDSLWVGTYGNHALNYRVLNLPNRFDTTVFAVTEKLIPITNGYAALSYEDGVQFVYPNKKNITITTSQGLPANAVYDVHEYKDSFWISTAKGIAVYTNNKVIKTYNSFDGIMGNRCAFSFHDKYGMYWLITDKYLHEFSNNKFHAVSTAPVVEGDNDVVQSCIYNSNNNTLVTGSLKRIFISQLNNIKRQDFIISPSLHFVQYDKQYINNYSSFELPAQFKNVSFTFKPTEANPFSKPTLYYKLTGLNENFVQLKDSLTISFSKLRSGKYKLIAKSINEDGVESKEIIVSEFVVDAPYWQKAWFVGLCICAAALSLFGINYLIKKRKDKRIEALKEIENRLNKERERISKDLHDHLGTSLVTMIAQTDNIENKLLNNQSTEALEKVQQLSEQSRETVNVLRETIWAVQENSHSLDEFVLRTRSFLQRVLPQKNIEWNVMVSGSIENKLTANQSLQLFRIIQEATQNIVKHSGATKASYCFTASPQLLLISIEDNGIGFNTSLPANSNGLINMQKRINDISGNIEITSQINHGTTITLSIPLTIKPV